MFQNVNVAKSAPFALLTIYQKKNPCIPPKFLQLPPFWQITRNSPTIFRFQLQALQAQDEKCTSLTAMLRRGKLDPLVYSINDGVLHRRVIEGGQTFQAIYVPRTPPGLI